MSKRRVRHFTLWIALALIVVLFSAFTGLAVYVLHPMLPAGRGIGYLSLKDQVAYLILADQIGSNTLLAEKRQHGGSLSVAIGTPGGPSCRGADPDLLAALRTSWPAERINLTPSACDHDARETIFVVWSDALLLGGFSCGVLCGGGGEYRIWHPLGTNMVLRVGEFYR